MPSNQTKREVALWENPPNRTAGKSPMTDKQGNNSHHPHLPAAAPLQTSRTTSTRSMSSTQSTGPTYLQTESMSKAGGEKQCTSTSSAKSFTWKGNQTQGSSNVESQRPTSTSRLQRLCSSRRASVSDAKRPSERARVFLGKTTMPEFREAEIQPQLFA